MRKSIVHFLSQFSKLYSKACLLSPHTKNLDRGFPLIRAILFDSDSIEGTLYTL